MVGQVVDAIFSGLERLVEGYIISWNERDTKRGGYIGNNAEKFFVPREHAEEVSSIWRGGNFQKKQRGMERSL